MSGEELKAAEPNTDQGVTAEDRAAAKLFCERMSIHPNDLDQAMRDHRLSSTAALEAEVERLKQRLESAEEALQRIHDLSPDVHHLWAEMARNIAASFLQEQEKQNG